MYTPYWGPSSILSQTHVFARTSLNIFTFHAINPMTKPIFHTTHAWLYHHPPKSEPSPPIIQSRVFLKNNQWISIVYTMCIYIHICILYTYFKPPNKLLHDITWLYHDLTVWRFPKSSGYPQIIQVSRLVTWGAQMCLIEPLGLPQFRGLPQNWPCSEDHSGNSTYE